MPRPARHRPAPFHARPRAVVLAGLVAACGPTRDGPDATGGATEPTASSSGGATDPTASSSDGASGSSTGAPACALAIGDGAPLDADPQGCYAIADEETCAAEQCTVLTGNPATCAGETLCAGEATVFLGCRPFVICKPGAKFVCRPGPAGVEAFFTMQCVPEGFGLCAPQPALEPPDRPLCD